VRSKGTAATALLVGVVTALYGTTGVLEAARRALNVVFRVEGGRSFIHRKAVDVASTFVLMALVLVTLILVFVGGEFADDLFEEIGFGADAAKAWSLARWPAAVLAAMVAFSWVYYITPDVEERSFRWVTPGAVVGVGLWLATSYLFSAYISNFGEVSALYGAFTAVILLLAWLWLTSGAMLFGAELNAQIGRERNSA
jgi:membrane protein